MSAQSPSPEAPHRRRIVLGVAAAVALAVAIAVAVAVLGGGKEVSLADAAANIEGEAYRARFDLEVTGSEPFTFAGTAVTVADQSRALIDGNITIDGTMMAAKMRLLDEDVWIDYGEGGPKLPGGRQWLHMRDEEMATSTMTPSEFVEFLEDAPDVENRGKEPVLGTRATRFHGNIDAAELASRTEGGAAKRMAEALEGADLKIPLDVWVTDDGLPKLMRMNMDVGQTNMRMEVEVLEYGVDVDVALPAESTVVEESELGG